MALFFFGYIIVFLLLLYGLATICELYYKDERDTDVIIFFASILWPLSLALGILAVVVGGVILLGKYTANLIKRK